jgi:CHAT domain-containing protein/tetratricopeptide (TPR) repeat protein
MHNARWRLIVTMTVSVLTLTAHPGALQTPANTGFVRSLSADVPIDTTLAPGGAHTYTFAAAANDFLHIVVEEHGIDVAAAVIGRDAREIVKVESVGDDFAVNTIVAIAPVDGVFSVAVRADSNAWTEGRYRIRLQPLHAATPLDEKRIEAERIFLRARRLRLTGGAERAEALPELPRAVALFQELGDADATVKSLIEETWLEYVLGRPATYETARRTLDSARAGGGAALARALYLLALAHERRGEMADSLRLVHEAIEIARALRDRRGEVTLLNQVGVLYGRTGQGEKAIEAMERSLENARITRSRDGEAVALNNLGIAYKNFGDFQRSLDSYNAALPIVESSGNIRNLVLLLNNLGNVLQLLGESSKALTVHLRALDLSRQGLVPLEEARSLNTIGQTYYALGEFERALDYHRQALTIRRQLNDPDAIAASRLGEGRVLLRLGRHQEAEAALREALALNRDIHSEYGEPQVLETLARVKRATNRLAEAVDDARTAVDLSERLRQRITSPELRASFQERAEKSYELLIDLLQDQHAVDPTRNYAAQALIVSERARGRVLLDSMLDAHVDLRAGVDPALLERERTLEKSLNDASTQLSRALASGSGSRETAAAAVERLSGEYRDVQAQIRRASPRYASVTMPEPLDAAAIQEQVVDRDTVLLEFALGEERSWLWAVTNEALTSVPLPPRADIESAARLLHSQLAARQPRKGEKYADYTKRVVLADRAAQAQSRAVSRLLLGGIAPQLNGPWRDKRLVVVSSGVLTYLPFAALPLPDTQDDASRSPVPLISRHELVTVPSASVLAALRRDTGVPQTSAPMVAVLADPVFDTTDPRLRVRGQQGNSAASPSIEARRISEVATRAGLARLPFSREEADSIATLAGSRAVFKATDFRASRTTALSSAVTSARVVHFATHGWLDNEHPDLTGLLLSLVDERGVPRDGLLRLDDIYNLHLNADLVVLSACQTALGREMRGEGLQSLTRAFMYAGAPRVIASLWEVSDIATAGLMKRLYAGILKRGLSPAAALRAAQLEMARDPRWASPYFWSGFVLQGDWTPIDRVH